MISDFYTKLFTVEAYTTALSAMGSWEPTTSTVGTFYGFIDLISQIYQSEKVGDQYLTNATHIIGCAASNSWITTSHRIKDSGSLYYNVLLNDDPVGRAHHREIYLEYKGADQLST